MIHDRPQQLEMHWSPVTDQHGRVRMEAAWIASTAPTSTPVSTSTSAPMPVPTGAHQPLVGAHFAA